MKKCDAPAVRNDDTALEFPDWSGMDDSANRVSAEAAFELTEQYASWFPEAARRWAQRESQKCLVEFTL